MQMRVWAKDTDWRFRPSFRGVKDEPGISRFRVLCCASHRNRSSRPDVRQERVDLRPQHLGFPAQRVGGAEHLAGGGAGFRGSVADADDVARYFAGAAGGVLDVARDLAGRGALFLDRRRDRGGDVVDLALVEMLRIAETAVVVTSCMLTIC